MISAEVEQSTRKEKRNLHPYFLSFVYLHTRELHLNSSYGLGILRQPFRTMSCRKFGSTINVGMSGIFLTFF